MECSPRGWAQQELRIHHGVRKQKKLNIWDRYSDSTSTTSAEESGKGGGKGNPRHGRPVWPPAQDQTKTRVPLSYEMKPSNRGRNEWKQWQEQVKPAVSEGTETRQSWSRGSETAAGSSRQSWWSSDQQIGRRSSQWSAPTSKQLAGSGYATDREWHETTKWDASGWANDPSQWTQYTERAKPTYSDPSDDQRSDAAMPSGTTSKTWQPGLDRPFWSNTYGEPQSEAASWASASAPPVHWQPRDIRRNHKCRWRLLWRWRRHFECPIDVHWWDVKHGWTSPDGATSACDSGFSCEDSAQVAYPWKQVLFS